MKPFEATLQNPIDNTTYTFVVMATSIDQAREALLREFTLFQLLSLDPVNTH